MIHQTFHPPCYICSHMTRWKRSLTVLKGQVIKKSPTSWNWEMHVIYDFASGADKLPLCQNVFLANILRNFSPNLHLGRHCVFLELDLNSILFLSVQVDSHLNWTKLLGIVPNTPPRPFLRNKQFRNLNKYLCDIQPGNHGCTNEIARQTAISCL